MFCMNFPCTCEKPEKKAAPRKKAAKKPAGDEPVVVEVQVPRPEPTVDIAAAMKAAAMTDQKHDTSEIQGAKPRWISREEADEIQRRKIEAEAEKDSVPDDPDFIPALNALEPILHPDEKERFSAALSSPSSRAARWKARNGR